MDSAIVKYCYICSGHNFIKQKYFNYKLYKVINVISIKLVSKDSFINFKIKKRLLANGKTNTTR